MYFSSGSYENIMFVYIQAAVENHTLSCIIKPWIEKPNDVIMLHYPKHLKLCIFSQTTLVLKIKIRYNFYLNSSSYWQIFNQYRSLSRTWTDYLHCDRSFGLIEKEKQKREKIVRPEERVHVIKNTSTNFVITFSYTRFIFKLLKHKKSVFKQRKIKFCIFLV